MRKRQLIAALMAGVVTCGALAGCGGGDSSAQNQDGEQTTAASSGQGQSAGGNSESGSAPGGQAGAVRDHLGQRVITPVSGSD